jgi:1-acyl-sn-glycerol-3-phosphate acyltransferase
VFAVIAAIRSLLTYVAVSSYVLIMGPIVLSIALLFGNVSILYSAGRGGVRLGLILSGVKLRIEGTENIVRDRAAVYVVNHTSNVEPPILFEALHELFPRLRVLYKAELRKLPILVRAWDLAGFVPLERGNREQSLPAIDRAALALRDGNSFLIFPEGTRSRTGALLPFKKGGFIMAIQAQAPIVPVAISGAHAAMHKGSLVIQPVTVQVRFGEPVETAGMTITDRDTLSAVVRGKVERLLAEARLRADE